MPATVLLSERREDGVPLPYTASPLSLLWSDIRLGLRNLQFVPGVVRPLRPWRSGKLDELYPSRKNLFDIAVHGFLCVFQTFFILSLPLCIIWMLPVLWIMAYAAAVLLANHTICRLALNGSCRYLESRVLTPGYERHHREHWIFINGVAVGHHWLQNELDRLAYTFDRKVTGVHNTTKGIIFDVIECVMQRCFDYSTGDIREAYPLVKNALLSTEHDRVILILHSQGGIEGGLIIDWLLDEMSRETLHKLEVYTFGNAANHFNNPLRSLRQRSRPYRQVPQYTEADDRCIRHIEHYANSKDFISLWGVLNFANIANRYIGRLFVRQGSGHQFNQHYLDVMFTLGPDRRVLDSNEFMDSVVGQNDRGGLAGRLLNGHDGTQGDVDGRSGSGDEVVRVKDFSRLWQYRNGRLPS